MRICDIRRLEALRYSRLGNLRYDFVNGPAGSPHWQELFCSDAFESATPAKAWHRVVDTFTFAKPRRPGPSHNSVSRFLFYPCAAQEAQIQRSRARPSPGMRRHRSGIRVVVSVCRAATEREKAKDDSVATQSCDSSRASSLSAHGFSFRGQWGAVIQVCLLLTERTEHLQQNGVFVLRFLSEGVGKHLDHVLDTILATPNENRQKTPANTPSMD